MSFFPETLRQDDSCRGVVLRHKRACKFQIGAARGKDCRTDHICQSNGRRHPCAVAVSRRAKGVGVSASDRCFAEAGRCNEHQKLGPARYQPGQKPLLHGPQDGGHGTRHNFVSRSPFYYLAKEGSLLVFCQHFITNKEGVVLWPPVVRRVPPQKRRPAQRSAAVQAPLAVMRWNMFKSSSTAGPFSTIMS